MEKKYLLLIFSLFFSIITAQRTVHAANENLQGIYTVKPGDSLPQIARIFETSVREVIDTNGLQSTTLLEGQKLRVPFMHEVQVGDTPQTLSTKYQSSEELIKTVNKLSSEHLPPGRVIKILPRKMNRQGQHILMTREEFKDWLFNSKFNRKITLIQHHHTWLPAYKHFKGNNHFQMLNSMENHHKRNMGWSNVAQNITTFPDGKIAVSRPFNIAPEGSIGAKANREGIAIENVGNFDFGHDVMTKEQKDTIIYITALLCLKFGLNPSVDSITYHHWWHYKTGERVLDNAKDYEVKSCPGTAFFGGNSTDSAKKYFYPLVLSKMKELKEERD